MSNFKNVDPYKVVQTTMTGLLILRDDHKEKCPECIANLDCPILAALILDIREEMERLRWNPPEKKTPVDGNGPYYYFNPSCHHERTSFDIMTCERCLRHSQEVQDQ